VLPGEGGPRSADLIRALKGTGWNGFLDVEIFSTPDRFWGLPVDEAARRAHALIHTLAQTVP
jgi:sugar phosphate isomerase/epimerase